MEIEWKIKEINEGGKNRKSVKVEYTNPNTNKIEELNFNFKKEAFLEDAFIEKIKKELDTKFDTSIKITKEKYVGKTYYHKIGQ